MKKHTFLWFCLGWVGLAGACFPPVVSPPAHESRRETHAEALAQESLDAANEGLPERASERPEPVSEGRLDTTPEPTPLQSCKQHPSYDQPCPLSTKDCSAFGRWLCASDGLSLRCHLSEDNACDGKDNDCDGKIDEDCPILLRSFPTQKLQGVVHLQRHASGDLLLAGWANSGQEIGWGLHRAQLPTTYTFGDPSRPEGCNGWWAARVTWDAEPRWLIGGAADANYTTPGCFGIRAAELLPHSDGTFFLRWEITAQEGKIGGLAYRHQCDVCLLAGHYNDQGQLLATLYKEELFFPGFPFAPDPSGAFFNLYGGRYFEKTGFLERQAFDGTLLSSLSNPCGSLQKGSMQASGRWFGLGSTEKDCEIPPLLRPASTGGPTFFQGTTPHRLERAFRCSGKAQALWLRETSEGHFLTFLSVEAAGLQCPSFEKPLQEGHYLLRWDASWKLLWSLPLNAVRINGFSLKETLVLDSQGEVWAVVWEEETFVFSLQRISKHGEIRSRIPLEFPKGEAPTALASFPGKGIALVGWVGAYRRNVRIGHLSLPEQSEPRLFLALFPVP